MLGISHRLELRDARLIIDWTLCVCTRIFGDMSWDLMAVPVGWCPNYVSTGLRVWSVCTLLQAMNTRI